MSDRGSRWSDLLIAPDRPRLTPDLDPELPALVLWVTPFSLHHMSLGVFRSLGRAGVPVYALTGQPDAPVLKSRYVRGQVVWQPHRGEGYNVLIDRLLAFGRELGRRSLIVCTSDEMAVLVARRRAVLEEWFVLPDVQPRLPAALADKDSLAEICRQQGFQTPPTMAVDTMAELETAIAEIGLPVMVKSTALRGQVQSVTDSTLVQTADELREAAQGWVEPFQVIVQEFLPDDHCEDWFTHGYCDVDGQARVVFSGRKVRSWPSRGGSTAAAYSAPNTELVALAADFCAKVAFRGVFDIDWRLDRRTGRYYLLDFNPRVGAQFRMFEDTAGVDVVRALHLDMSGRPIPAGSQIDGQRYVVEAWDIPSLVSRRGRPLEEFGGSGRPKAAWLARDDMAPVWASFWAQVRQSVGVRLRRLFITTP